MAKDNILLEGKFPYYLGKDRGYVMPGEQTHLFISVENRTGAGQLTAVRLFLPPGLSLADAAENWTAGEQDGRRFVEQSLALAAGFDQWFDLVPIVIDSRLAAGAYSLEIAAGERRQMLAFAVDGQNVAGGGEKIAITGLVLPLDKDGKLDERLSHNTLTLRDRSLDYYKNFLRGKGAANQEIEAMHPLTHLGIDIENPAGLQQLAVVTTRLLDKNTRQPVPGLFTPGTTGEDKNAGALAGTEGSLTAFAAITGEAAQRIQVPVYADERLLKNGEYILHTELSGGGTPLSRELELTIVKKDNKAMLSVLLAALALLAGVGFAVRRLKRLFAGMKVRWLITIALFGAAAFVLVNIPAAFLSDLFHVLLGPFGVLISGFFSGVVLYMLVVSLLVLIPRPGTAALMLTVRMLLSLAVFGHFSPVMLMSYGVCALLLETLLYFSGFYRSGLAEAAPGKPAFWRNALILAAVCAIADSAATYTGLQASAFLYRMYYAEWYVLLLVLMNGCVYTAAGAICGIVLGSRLARVGGD